MPSNILNGISLNFEAGTNFLGEFNNYFLIPYSYSQGTRSGVSPGQLRCKSGVSPAV
jgi:hypothetical protein